MNVLLRASSEAAERTLRYSERWCLGSGYDDDTIDLACAVVVELVENARRHASSPQDTVLVGYSVVDDGMCVEVRDVDRDPPDGSKPFGRDGAGFTLLRRSAVRWGVWYPLAGGKVVHAVLPVRLGTDDADDG